jgi:flagellar FliL protein
MAAAEETAEAAEAAPEPAPRKGGSVLVLIAAMLLLTALAAGGGVLLGFQLVTSIGDSVRHKADSEAAAKYPVASRYTGDTSLLILPPVITNIAAPEDVWIRLESSIVLEEGAVDDADLLAGKISEDILAYLRTVTLPQISGASGFQHLRDDLQERLAIRSEGRVNELVIQTLVIQ